MTLSSRIRLRGCGFRDSCPSIEGRFPPHRPSCPAGRVRHRGDRGRTRTRRTRWCVDPRRALRRAPAGTQPRSAPEDHRGEAVLRPRRRCRSVPRRCRAAIGNTRLASELEVLLALGAAHGEAALVSALHRAVAFRRFRAADVRSILAAGTGTPQPRTAGDALILDLPVAPTRSLDAYKVAPAVADGEVIS